MTLSEITARLAAAGVDSPRFDALELIGRFAGVPRAAALAAPEADYPHPPLTAAVDARRARQPLAYILGEWDFMGHTFRVTPDCLVPRSDTELLCSLLIAGLPLGGTFADLCTGSGCIAIAALLERPDAIGAALEFYPAALAVAKENARRLGVTERLTFIEADVRTAALPAAYDWIVSNPPYVTASEMEHVSPEVQREPAHALTDGGDGLAFYRSIFARYPAYLNPGGTLAVEIGWQQADTVCAIAAEHGMIPTVHKDLEHRDRVITAVMGQ